MKTDETYYKGLDGIIQHLPDLKAITFLGK